MNKADFLFLLYGASYASFKFGQGYLKNNLKPEFRYDLELNASYDNPEFKNFDIYLDDDGKNYLDLIDKKVVNILCRNNKVPVWMDISVSKSDRKKQHLNFYVQVDTQIIKTNSIIQVEVLDLLV